MADVQFSGPIYDQPNPRPYDQPNPRPYDQPPPQVIHFDEALPPQGPNLPWFDATGKADGAMARKFIINYLTAVQSDLQRPDNSKLFDFIKVSLKPTIQASFLRDNTPTFVGVFASSVGKALYDSVQIKSFIPNLIQSIRDLSDANDLGAIAGIPFGFPDKKEVKRLMQQHIFKDLKPNGLPDNIADLLIPILLNNRDAALMTVTPPAPWSSATGYPVGSRAVNKGVTYEKMLPPTSPSANTAGTVWKKLPSGASGGGRRTRGKKGRKASRRR